MSLVRIEYHHRVAMWQLSHGVTNALSPQLVRELWAHLQMVREDSQTRGLVLTSANDKFFSIGLDIPKLFDLSREEFSSFYHTFNQVCLSLYTLPKPTVAAITGHAIAGGCILTLCCDHRLIAQGRKLMALNEVKLGVPVPYPADCILRQIAGTDNALEIMQTGELYQPEDLLQMNVVDQVLPLEQVRPKALEKAQQLATLPEGPFGAAKQKRVEAVRAEVLAQLAEKERIFVQHWYSDEARELLREAMEKF